MNNQIITPYKDPKDLKEEFENHLLNYNGTDFQIDIPGTKKFQKWLKDNGQPWSIGSKEFYVIPKKIREEIMSWSNISWVSCTRSYPHRYIFKGTKDGDPQEIEWIGPSREERRKLNISSVY